MTSAEGEQASSHKEAPLTAFQKSQLALAEQIKRLESNRLKEKPWKLMGEVTARIRPKDSLLDEDSLEFDRSFKATEGLPEEEIEQEADDMIKDNKGVDEDPIEKIIKNRILARAFDDVQPMLTLATKTAETTQAGHELNHEKTGRSLAEEYEVEYQKACRTLSEHRAAPSAATPANAKLAQQHASCRALFKQICGQLDAMSSSRFLPPASQRVYGNAGFKEKFELAQQEDKEEVEYDSEEAFTKKRRASNKIRRSGQDSDDEDD